MFGTRWRLFRVSGIPIYVDASWLFVLALVTVSLAEAFPRWMERFFPRSTADDAGFWGLGLLAALAFFACIVLHELGHATVGRAQGMSIRGITLFLFGGVAELGDEPPSAGSEFFMAIAGPVVSLFLAIIFGLLTVIGYNAAWPPRLLIVLGYLGLVNALVLAFNLIPAFPLDGGRVFRSMLWGLTGSMKRATYWSSLLGRAFAWLLIAWGIVEFFGHDLWGGIWLGLISSAFCTSSFSSRTSTPVMCPGELPPTLFRGVLCFRGPALHFAKRERVCRLANSPAAASGFAEATCQATLPDCRVPRTHGARRVVADDFPSLRMPLLVNQLGL